MNARLPLNRAAETLSSLVKKTDVREVKSLQQILPSIERMQLIFPEWTFKTCRLMHPSSKHQY